MPTGPSPFNLGGLGTLPGIKPLNLGVPAYQPPTLPGLAPANMAALSGPLPMDHPHLPKHHASAHHAPPPAKAAKACAPKPQAVPAHPVAPAHTVSGFLHNVPGSAKQLGLGLLHLPQTIWHTGNDIGTSLSDGVDAAYNRAFGDKDIADANDKQAAQADARTREKLLNLVPFGGSHGGIAHYR